MSDSPIFDQLISEFADKGAVYEDFTKWSTPAFRWSGSNRGVKMEKPKNAAKIGTWIHADDTANFGSLIQDYVSQVGQSFADHHPLAVVTDMNFEMNDDGSGTVVIDAVQPITSVMPLSERNTAQPME